MTRADCAYRPIMGVVELMLVRHGESMGNVAAAAADSTASEVVEVEQRDADVPLSPLGEAQAEALGAALGPLERANRPDVLFCSPYVRAAQTAQIALSTAGLAMPLRVDERLRDRELGILDMLTTAGVEARYPEEAARRRWLGKFYHRPPGGESWADVALRTRTLLTELDQLWDGCRVLLVCHDALILIVRYICEGLSEAQVLEITSTTVLRNVSVTRLVRPDGAAWTLDTFNDVSHLEAANVPATKHPGDPSALPG